MAFYGYTHATIESMQKYFSERNIQALLLEQFVAMHKMICAGNEHVEVTIGINKGKCKHCMKVIAKPIPVP